MNKILASMIMISDGVEEIVDTTSVKGSKFDINRILTYGSFKTVMLSGVADCDYAKREMGDLN